MRAQEVMLFDFGSTRRPTTLRLPKTPRRYDRKLFGVARISYLALLAKHQEGPTYH